MTDSIAEQDTSGLVPHPHRMILWGAPDTAEFPPLCPNCGNGATRKLALSKGFVRYNGTESPDIRTVLAVDVPFCDACIAQHDTLVDKPGAGAWLLSLFKSSEIFGAIAFGAAAIFTSYLALPELFNGRFSHFGMFALLTAIFFLIARSQYRTTLEWTAYYRVLPQTTVTQAFDYSDNDPPSMQSPRYTCTMRDPAFAAAFTQLNRAREFVLGSPAQVADRHAANRQAWGMGIVIAVIVLGMMAFKACK